MQSTDAPSRVAVPSRVRLDASDNRPVTLISPCRRTSPMTSAGSSSGKGPAVVAVQPRADVALGVERVAAQGAWRPPGGDDLLGVFGEVAGGGERQEHPQGVRPVLPVLQDDVLADLLLGQRQELDDHL